MRLALLATSMLVSGLWACASGSYGDAGADRPPIPLRNFDVDNSGTAPCPGELYGSASEGRATCSRTPQRCVSPQVGSGTSRIVCDCTSETDGGMGTWSCQERQ